MSAQHLHAVDSFESVTLGRNRAGFVFAAKTSGQSQAFRIMKNRQKLHRLITGPGGCGKTLMAVAAGLHFIEEGWVNRIVVMRPAVEMGEKMGFLPGALLEKIAPWARPIIEAATKLQRHIDPKVRKLQSNDNTPTSNDLIQVEAIGVQGGLTHDNAFIIVDEVQNLDEETQAYVIGTRPGEGSFITYLGSEDQCHLRKNQVSVLPRLGRMFATHPALSGASYSMTNDDIVRSEAARIFDEAWRMTSSSLLKAA